MTFDEQLSKAVIRLLVVGVVLAGAGVVPVAPQETESQQPAHTLTITTPEDKISYSFRVGGELQKTESVDTEDTDKISGQYAEGTVGLNGEDTYRFDGEITTFTTNNSNNLIITLDGEQIDSTEILDATDGFSGGESDSGGEQTDRSTSESTPIPTPTPTPTPTETATSTPTATPTLTPSSSTVLSITQFGPTAQTATVNEPAQFNLTVASNATTQKSDMVVIRADGRVVTQETVSLAPNSSKSTTFAQQFESTGPKTITVSFGGENETMTVAVVAPTPTPGEPQTAAATPTPAPTPTPAATQTVTTTETQTPATASPTETTANPSSGDSAGIVAGLDLAGISLVIGIFVMALLGVAALVSLKTSE